MKRVLFSCFALFGLLLASTSAMAHGGGGIEADKCVVNIGNYRMHFTAYQPQTIGGEELCWDLPTAGNSILVFDLVERVLRDRPVEVRVVEEQETASGPSNYKTIVERPVQRYPKGTIELEAAFANPGEYTAVVTLGGDQPLVFKAPIRVALQGEQTVQWIGAIAFAAVVIGLMVWFARRGKKEASA
ncbi:hypothetical protein [Nitrosococcus wardiae]|uniref:Uncharacterized protein n=1 Tax=Nitrosococcus wardiae TaxID=1814290 RepID=A0A4P7BTK8_9GAMM|nr:hypothetical protein [Nitrosococcus wardiae]QBQ53218.1 hypothetical protein E3U44_00905 [Nitrosococcus wardiae]